MTIQTQEAVEEHPKFHFWLEGIKAFEAGTKRDECPYTGPQADEWVSGFDTASVTITSDITQ